MESTRTDHALSRWSSQYLDAMQPYKNPRAALQLPNWMRSAGFTEVEFRLLTLPMCAWSNEPRDHNIGLANSENVAQLLQSLALYPFTQLKGMSIEDFEHLIEEAKSEASNPSFKAYFPLPDVLNVANAVTFVLAASPAADSTGAIQRRSKFASAGKSMAAAPRVGWTTKGRFSLVMEGVSDVGHGKGRMSSKEGLGRQMEILVDCSNDVSFLPGLCKLTGAGAWSHADGRRQKEGRNKHRRASMRDDNWLGKDEIGAASAAPARPWPVTHTQRSQWRTDSSPPAVQRGCGASLSYYSLEWVGSSVPTAWNPVIQDMEACDTHESQPAHPLE
ncbi:Uncharacterized protein TPAR_03612, partial [Tolypocladium paradoxum]